MTNTVGQVIEQLQRFNPLARVVPDLEIQGVSPATECRISSNGFSDTAQEISDLEDSVEEKLKDLESIHELCANDPKDKDKLVQEITEIVSEYAR